jgi:hypothetical protein
MSCEWRAVGLVARQMQIMKLAAAVAQVDCFTLQAHL